MGPTSKMGPNLRCAVSEIPVVILAFELSHTVEICDVLDKSTAALSRHMEVVRGALFETRESGMIINLQMQAALSCPL